MVLLPHPTHIKRITGTREMDCANLTSWKEVDAFNLFQFMGWRTNIHKRQKYDERLSGAATGTVLSADGVKGSERVTSLDNDV